MRLLLGTIRLAIFFLYTLFWLLLLLVLDRLGKLDDSNRLEYRQMWSRGMARIVGFRFEIEGKVPDSGALLFVGNHRSSLDPLLAFYEIKAWPVSRIWVKNWPLVGKGSQMTGIIFVDKENKHSRQLAKEKILEELSNGNSVLIYPEGQTNTAPYTSTFRKGSFEQAARGGFQVIPFVLEYKDTRDYWDHRDNFAMHFIKRFGKLHHDVFLSIGDPLTSGDPWSLLRQSQKWIDEKMAEIHTGWGNTQYAQITTPDQDLGS